jgi:glucose-6-phosphate isomerase
MAYAMFETIYLGSLWGVNVFNQPNVEEYKKRANDMLE